MTRNETIEKALNFFDEGFACSQSVLLTFAKQYHLEDDTAKLISSTFGGGMGRLRQKCGAVTAGFMILGLQYGNTNPKDMESKLFAYKKVRALNKQIEDIYDTSNCGELLKQYATNEQIEARQHHKIICRKVVADVTGIVYDMITL